MNNGEIVSDFKPTPDGGGQVTLNLPKSLLDDVRNKIQLDQRMTQKQANIASICAAMEIAIQHMMKDADILKQASDHVTVVPNKGGELN